jgi:hypothetical protein
MTERDPAGLYRFITTEIWCIRRYDLIDELISEDLIDHVDVSGLEGTGRSRYVASARIVHGAFSDSREEAEFVVADGSTPWDTRDRRCLEADAAAGPARLTCMPNC